MTRMRPRPTADREPRGGEAALVDDDREVRLPALRAVGAGFAWRLGVVWGDDERHDLTAIDGADGLFWADPEHQMLEPVSNTLAYRAFSTVLTASDQTPAQ